MAERVSGDGRGFGGLCFGPDNVGIWRLSIAVELGEAGRAREIARLTRTITTSGLGLCSRSSINPGSPPPSTQGPDLSPPTS